MAAVFWTLVILAGLYVGVGFLATFINAQSKDDEFKVDWAAIMKWPKDVFFK